MQLGLTPPAPSCEMPAVLKLLLFLLVIGMVALAGLLFFPAAEVRSTPLAPEAPDAGSQAIDPRGRSIEMLQPGRAPVVYVFLHGVTNSPRQFEQLGAELYKRGASVLIPRMPYHGYTDRLTPELKNFTAQVMLDEANRAIDRARTLGIRVVVAGLSVNGVTAAWVAMNRPDVDTAVVMSPFFAARGMPEWAVAPAGRLFLRIPNIFVWWDPKLREAVGEGTLTYPRFSTHSLASILVFGRQVFHQAATTKPVVQRVLVITSGDDMAVDNGLASELVALWRRDGAKDVETYEFPAGSGVPHDFVDPEQPDQQVAKVYPVLLRLFTGGTAP